MAYRFRLEAVFQYRQNLEELAQQRLARELALLAAQQQQLASLGHRLQQVTAEWEERKRRPMAASFYQLYQQVIDGLGEESRRQQTTIASQRRVVEEARAELLRRMQERKVLEKARQRDYERYLHGQRQQEQNDNDEQMVLRFGRRPEALF